MPRRDISFLPDQYYHFYNRGNNRQGIFFERTNYVYFLRGIKTYLRPHMDTIAYCLMPTHYHILGRVKPLPPQPQQTSKFLENSEVSAAQPLPQNSEFLENSEFWTPEASAAQTSNAVSQAMMRLSVSYTKAINKRFNRVGALFQGQFQAKPVRQFEHLLHLCAYIHANPVKDGLVDSPEDWEFSNYLEWMNLREGTLVDWDFIQANFGTSGEYQTLMKEYIQTRILPDDLRKYLQELES